MKNLAKTALGALMMAGTALGVTAATTAPADAGVSVGIGIGVPGPYYAPPPCGYYGCGYYNYSSPVYIGGTWYNGPHYYRYWGGHPWVWWHGGWHTGFNGGWRGPGWHGGVAGWHGGWRR